MFSLFSLPARCVAQRRLGKNGLVVPLFGLGCMGMSEFYGPVDPDACRATLRRALDLGCNFFDTAAIYGSGKNEIFLGETLSDVPRERYILATKCGVRRDPANSMKRIVDNSFEHIKTSCEESLARLRTDYIDLYYLHRIAKNGDNIEESMRAMAALLEEGKIRYVGLSEATRDIIERANSALLSFTGGEHQLTAIETEYSLMSRTPEIDGVIDVCRELDIGFVAYSPLGRRYLTGLNKMVDSSESTDVRRLFPRFQLEHTAHNQKIVQRIVNMATEKRCTPAQLSLAWLLAKGNNVVPIPGTRSVARLEENLLAAHVVLTSTDLERLETIAPIGAFSGERYPLSLMVDNNLKTEREIIEQHCQTGPKMVRG